jgi:asparagine N-glycosylation enzyme membrane subunit Stt3
MPRTLELATYQVHVILVQRMTVVLSFLATPITMEFVITLRFPVAQLQTIQTTIQRLMFMTMMPVLGQLPVQVATTAQHSTVKAIALTLGLVTMRFMRRQT